MGRNVSRGALSVSCSSYHHRNSLQFLKRKKRAGVVCVSPDRPPPPPESSLATTTGYHSDAYHSDFSFFSFFCCSLSSLLSLTRSLSLFSTSYYPTQVFSSSSIPPLQKMYKIYIYSAPFLVDIVYRLVFLFFFLLLFLMASSSHRPIFFFL